MYGTAFRCEMLGSNLRGGTNFLSVYSTAVVFLRKLDDDLLCTRSKWSSPPSLSCRLSLHYSFSQRIKPSSWVYSLERSLWPGWVRTPWVRSPSAAHFLKPSFKAVEFIPVLEHARDLIVSNTRFVWQLQLSLTFDHQGKEIS